MNARRAIILLFSVMFVSLVIQDASFACDKGGQSFLLSSAPAPVQLGAEASDPGTASSSAVNPWGRIKPVEGLNWYTSECTPRLTADGKTFIFSNTATVGEGWGGNGIFMATWNEETKSWNRPVNLRPNVVGNRPFISPDGKTLWYHGGQDIFESHWTGTEWTPGEKMPSPINSDSDDTEPAISFDGQRFYFASNRPGGYGSHDIYVATKTESGWGNVKNLGPAVNSSYYEGWPFETADQKRLYFGSWDRPGYGWADLWVSDAIQDGWGSAQNLGPPINTDLPACSPFVTADGKHFYCGSEANEGSFGDEDIWVANLASEEKKEPAKPARAESVAGSPWTNTGELAGAEFVYSLIETRDGTLYAGTYPNGDVFRSTDKGSTWANTSDLAGAQRVYCLLEDSDGAVLAGTYPNGDVFKTTDSGKSWTKTTDLPGVSAVRCLLRAHDGAIYAGAAQGLKANAEGKDFAAIFKTTDSGKTWQDLGGLPTFNSAVWTLCETNQGTLLAGGCHPSKMFRSTDGGKTWQESGPAGSELPYMRKALDKIPIKAGAPQRGISGTYNSIAQVSDGSIFVGVWPHARGASFFKSTDDGLNWVDICDEIPLKDDRGDVGLAPLADHRAVRIYSIIEGADKSLFAGFQPGPEKVVFRSTDHGQTWLETGRLVGAREALCLLRGSDGTIYAGTTPNGDVFKLAPEKK